MFLELKAERFHDYPVTTMVTAIFRGPEWALLMQEGFQTVDVYEDGRCLLIKQPLPH